VKGNSNDGFGFRAWPESWQPSKEIRQTLETAGFFDSSWINEGAPHWLLPVEGRRHGISAIWIYPEKSNEREPWMATRFSATILKEDGIDAIDEYETNDLNKAIEYALKARLAYIKNDCPTKP